MNYRRGFQRLYAVLTFAWVAVLLFALPSDRLKFWQTVPITLTDADFAPPQLSPVPATSVPLPPPGFTFVPLPPPGSTLDTVLSQHGTVEPAPKKSKSGGIPVEEPLKPPPPIEDRPEGSNSRTQKGRWLAGVLFMPPAIGYALLFLVIPWIYRGFRPAGTQLAEKP